MKRTAWLALALLVAGLQAGCVTRRVMITSEPPGAMVYRNGQPIGPTPVEEPFLYYGRYHYRFVADGYQPLDLYPEFATQWYEYPGVDFFAENVFPFAVRDVQQVHARMIPLEPVRHDDVKSAADNLRNRGQMIQPPANAPPRRSRNPAPAAPPTVSSSAPGEPSPERP